MNIEQCVAHYVQNGRTAASREMSFYQKQPTLFSAIRLAANCAMSNGRKHPHQWRLPNAVLKEAERRLMACATELEASKDFETLHAFVNRAISPIRGIGELTVYDVAQRIGAFLCLMPNRVYLHAGARVGAAALGLSGTTLRKEQLPIAFAQLTAAEIEDCLCVYKGCLSGKEAEPANSIDNARVKSCLPKRTKNGRCS